ncbi:MAG: permease-like cell division protein FtsX [Bacteroidales bacterium]|nr:permease-like cell division protein FtsX [Candidatus Cacconaster caballi]
MEKKKNNIVAKRLIRSYITSVVSISLVLILVAAAAILAANANNIARYFKENMTVSVILKPSTSEKEARALEKDLSKKSYVKESRYVSKEEGAKEMEALLGADFLNVFESSPIPISIDLKLDGDVITRDSLNYIKGNLQKSRFVEEVVYQETLVEALNANLHKIGLIVGAVILILLFISFALISNTVRLNIYARRFTIHTMSLVGAKRSFIARPFVKQAVLEGAASGLLASAVMLGIVAYVKNSSPLLENVIRTDLEVAVLGLTVLLGILICVISTLIVVRRVAYISKDDLYY